MSSRSCFAGIAVSGHSVLFMMMALVALSGCTHEPTTLPIPENAADLRQFPFGDGRVFQTEFSIKAAYPSDPMTAFYRNRMPEPWIPCGLPNQEWSRFMDATGGEPVQVDQQLRHWINRDTNRLLMLSARYLSHRDRPTGDPVDDVQHIILIEQIGRDIDEAIEFLNLQCDGDDPVAP